MLIHWRYHLLALSHWFTSLPIMAASVFFAISLYVKQMLLRRTAPVECSQVHTETGILHIKHWWLRRTHGNPRPAINELPANVFNTLRSAKITTDILWTNILKCTLLKGNLCTVIESLPMFVPKKQIENKSSLVRLIAWPLFSPKCISCKFLFLKVQPKISHH